MKIFDRKFKNNKLKYVIQSMFALLTVLFISILLDVLLHATLIASIGATVFIVFTMPHTIRSKSRYIVGGYTIGILIGSLGHLVYFVDFVFVDNLIIALAVGISIFCMSITNTEHPPAAAVAMAVVVEGIDLYTISIIYLCLIIVLLIKRLLNKWLINLV